MTLRERFFAFDDRLAQLGVPPLTKWWRDGIGAWLDAYEADGALELWACVGRGAAKSTALYKLALFFALFGNFAVPPGERHWAIVLSRLKEEASKGVAIIVRWLTLLGVAHHPAGDVIELDDLPRGIRVVAASVSAASGWRAFFVGKDERSKWPTGDKADREAGEIDASAAAMTATHARAPIAAFGSAWAKLGGFYEAIASGTDAHKHVLGPAPTWVAAPHVTEESTKRKERDPAMWLREYACVASEEHEESLFSAALLDAATRPEHGDVPPELGVSYVCALDPAHTTNAFTAVIAAERFCGVRLPSGGYAPGARLRRSIVAVREWRGTVQTPLRYEAVLKELAPLCRSYRIEFLWTDQYEEHALREICSRPEFDLQLSTNERGALDRHERFQSLRTRLADGEIEIPPHKQLRADLLAVRRKLTDTSYTIHLPTDGTGRHCDFVPSAVLALYKTLGPPSNLTLEQQEALRKPAIVGPPPTMIKGQSKADLDAEQEWLDRAVEEQHREQSNPREFWEDLADQSGDYFT